MCNLSPTNAPRSDQHFFHFFVVFSIVVYSSFSLQAFFFFNECIFFIFSCFPSVFALFSCKKRWKDGGEKNNDVWRFFCNCCEKHVKTHSKRVAPPKNVLHFAHQKHPNTLLATSSHRTQTDWNGTNEFEQPRSIPTVPTRLK